MCNETLPKTARFGTNYTIYIAAKKHGSKKSSIQTQNMRHPVRLKRFPLRHLTNDNSTCFDLVSFLRLTEIALQPTKYFSSNNFSIPEYRRQLDHPGLKAAATMKLKSLSIDMYKPHHAVYTAWSTKVF